MFPVNRERDEGLDDAFPTKVKPYIKSMLTIALLYVRSCGGSTGRRSPASRNSADAKPHPVNLRAFWHKHHSMAAVEVF